MTSSAPSGPAGNQMDAFVADPEGLLHELQTRGDVVAVDLDGVSTAVIYEPELAHRVFADKLEHVGLPAAFERIRHASGNGLLTNYDWETWFPRRRVIVKPLGARAVGQFRDRMTAIIDEELDSWAPGQHEDLMASVRTITLRVVADLLFTTDLTLEAVEIIGRAVDEMHAWAEADPANTDVDHLPASFQAAAGALDRFIRSVIDSRNPADPGDDMVGRLIAASHDEAVPLDQEGVRDEAVTLMLAGHETVTNTITFAIDLLSRHPEAIDQPARHIVDETLRMYPPVQITTRLVTKDLELGDYTIPAGWEVLVPEIVYYRDERYFERADEFLPERWADDSPLRLERRAYFPFLTGPKFCVGSHFALLEATEAIDRFRRRFRIKPLDPEPPRGRFFALSYGPDKPIPYHLERV